MSNVEKRKKVLRDLIDDRLKSGAEKPVITAEVLRELLHEMVDHLVVEPGYHK